MKALKTTRRLTTHPILNLEQNIETVKIRHEFDEKDKINEAIKSISDVIESSPLNANAYFMRATLKVRAGDIEGARTDFRMSEACHRSSSIKIPEYPLV